MCLLNHALKWPYCGVFVNLGTGFFLALVKLCKLKNSSWLGLVFVNNFNKILMLTVISIWFLEVKKLAVNKFWLLDAKPLTRPE